MDSNLDFILRALVSTEKFLIGDRNDLCFRKVILAAVENGLKDVLLDVGDRPY
jgi:hypothetical protein